MAGVLLRELKLRGLVERTLIVRLTNRMLQWQRELKEKPEKEDRPGAIPQKLRSRFSSSPQGLAVSRG